MTQKPVHVLNGPNLNLLGMRQPEIYGHDTLEDIEALCRSVAGGLGFDILFRQSNHVGEIVEMIHDARTDAACIVINPAAYTHTSVAIRDALASCDKPIYEVHISNVHRREAFRHQSYVSGVATGVIAGLGIYGYAAALHAFSNMLPVPGDFS